MKLERLISMIYMLLNNEVISASALADKYEVSQRTIYRDIEAISAAGIPVVSYQGVNGGYGIIDSYKMDKSLLNAYDAETLITVLSGLSTVFEDEQAMDTVRKLQTIQRDNANPVLNLEMGGHPLYNQLLRDLREAITRRTVIQFDYISWKNERTKRSVEPASLKFRRQAWYLYGFCRERNNFREFKLSRISDMKVLAEHFQRRVELPPVERDPYQRNEGAESVDVLLRFTKRSLALALDHFNNQERTYHEDGSMTIKLQLRDADNTKWLIRVLLSFGEDAEIIEPASLRQELKMTLGKMMQIYSDEV
ncbi:helix-turn-helix transcriptional regulator [Paenibacillus radicis (ex Gao et al. 2016)]|uniref:DeoR family transcriptional regulator n=1 Tax=Paenibacillus radicis (ex Gao et al. 2016) TaxID=1737354 RepID=A0A917H179_9BACL|nr:YafY family protein [Paenibacillus radicis (ex Gao et al. 2016)]GGG64291.1 DeoR family transcriptional regulator [Paenibacillus radicis (ex Gao et al. 2016)]